MGYGRAVVWGVCLGVLAVVAGVLAVVVFGPAAASPATKLGDRAMVVVATSGGTDGSRVAEIVCLVDLSRGGLDLTLVDPWMSVTVPGTSYDRLRDAYPFGGGRAVAEAYARSTTTTVVPVVSVSEDAFRVVVSRLGGVTVDVPSDGEIFDGKRLHTFRAGRATLDAPTLVALLQSADYIRGADGARLRSAVATGLASAAARRLPEVADLVRAGSVSSSLADGDLWTLGGRLRGAAPRLRFADPTR